MTILRGKTALFPLTLERNPVELDEKLLLKKKQVLLPFSNTMVHCKTQAMQMHGYKLHIMTHAPYPEDKSSLPNGIYVLKTYTELKDGSRNMCPWSSGTLPARQFISPLADAWPG